MFLVLACSRAILHRNHQPIFSFNSDAPTSGARGTGGSRNETGVALGEGERPAADLQRDHGGVAYRQVQRTPYMGTGSYCEKCGRLSASGGPSGRGDAARNTHIQPKLQEQPEREVLADDTGRAGETGER